jgi:hypothetical protein
MCIYVHMYVLLHKICLIDLCFLSVRQFCLAKTIFGYSNNVFKENQYTTHGEFYPLGYNAV